MRDALHPHVVRAIVKRDVRLYFSNPSGYVFVTLFILLSAAAAFWQRRFFLNNLANLEQLNNYFPYLLLLFIPALTMSAWADERKQGTDELLFTLPASDLDIVLGKYLATVTVYSLAVLLSLSHAIVLFWLARPDPGLMVTNYVGYWLVGVALIAVGMVASLLTANVTVAFILGSVFCTIPILMATVVGVFSDRVGGWVAPLGVDAHFLDFARGVIPLSGLLYFASLAGFFLYLNVVLVGRRHWPRHTTGVPITTHQVLRAMSVCVALVGFNVLVSRLPVRLDATAERLNSLSDETRRLIDGVTADHPVFIQAFVSPEVPELYVQTRENLLSVLHEIASRARAKVQVLITETTPYSKEAQTARERFGITPRPVADPNNPQAAADGIVLAVAVTSGAEEQVVPFVDRGLSPEYEITRDIRVVAQAGRKRIGVIKTEVQLLGGIDRDSGQPRQPWMVVKELAKQYDIVQISAAVAITEKVDALLVALPSTLLQYEMDNVNKAILDGVPALVLIDPVTSVDMRLSPAAPMFERVNPYASQEPRLRKNLGDVRKMMADIGVAWQPARIAWDSYNPHPDMAQLPREVLFIGKGSGSSEPFNPRHPATAGLQELMLLYSGSLAPQDPSKFRFEPLLRTGSLSGTVSYFQLVQPSPEGPIVNTGLLHEPDKKKEEYVPAAAIHSQPGNQNVNAIVIGDLDFISDQFFQIRAEGASNARFDNISFFLNSMDVLTGDSPFIGLRRRRPRYRTLERVEVQTRTFAEKRLHEEQQAESEAKQARTDAQNRRSKRIASIQARADLDEQAKQIMVRNVDEVEKRKLEVLSANIDLAEQSKIQASRENMESQVQRIRDTIRTIAVVAPPIPVCALGVFIFVRRRRREREGAAAIRRLRNMA